MSRRLAATLLALFFVIAAGSPPARADDISQMQLINNAAVDVQASITDLKSALLADGDPKVRSVFSLLNNLNARAHEIETVTYKNLGNIADGDIEAIAFIVLMEAARSAQEDLRAIMNGVREINQAKAKQRQTFLLLQQREHIATATEAVINSTDDLLDLFGLNCVFCDD
jgi:hypothetical protein